MLNKNILRPEVSFGYLVMKHLPACLGALRCFLSRNQCMNEVEKETKERNRYA